MTGNNSFRLCPLASGSRGNSLFVSCGDFNFLVDAGLSGVEIERRLNSAGLEPETLQALVITHEHSDHVKGAGILSRRYNIPVYITRKTWQASTSLGKISDLRFFECGTVFKLGQADITPFSTSHDACDSTGLAVEYGEFKLGIATDLGIVTSLVKEHLKNSHALYLESNHDPDMLINGPYPWNLKQRIKGRTGHLSNKDARNLIKDLKSDQLKHVILAHLSEENNTPERAASEALKAINSSDIRLHVARPDQPGEIIKLG